MIPFGAKLLIVERIKLSLLSHCISNILSNVSVYFPFINEVVRYYAGIMSCAVTTSGSINV